jgi:hypothetical protein
VSEAQARRFNDSVEFITDYDPETEGTNGIVTDLTLLEYGKIGDCIDPDEVIGVGIYPVEHKKIRWRRIEYRRVTRIRRAVETPLYSYGSVQGLMYSWVKGTVRPYFQLREFASDQLVRCYYDTRVYRDIHGAWEHPNAVVHATGEMTLERANRRVEEMTVERLDRVEPLTNEELLSLFGSAPDLTGGETTEEFIDRIRQDAE